MIFNSHEFARRYAFIYTGILAVLLMTPLVIYVGLLLQIDEAKIQLSLESHVKEIVNSMQHYDNDDKIYYFPRYKSFNAALYDDAYKEIFSTLPFKPNSFTEGIHKKDKYYYYIYTLPAGFYFNANYLLVSTIHRANDIYYFATLVIIAIIFALFLFSYLLLKNFSLPFEKLNKSLDHFIKDSMHEINTPLSIININADLSMQIHGKNKYIDRIKSASKTLATIYNDMDYLVKQGRVIHKVSVLDLGEFIQNRVEYFQEVANLKSITLNTMIEEGMEYSISKTKLQRIIVNTLSNAIKYSNDDSTVDILLKREEANIVFSVQDYGVGIRDTSKIFSRYYRENQAKGGFGIGLNIVKQIIDEEKIILTVHSQVGKGTVFSYRF